MKKILFILSLFLVVIFILSVFHSQTLALDCPDLLINPIYMLDVGVFRKPKDKVVLSKKVKVVLDRIRYGAYQDALDKLVNDVLEKVDGDKNDWIIDRDAQSTVYDWAVGLIFCLSPVR